MKKLPPPLEFEESIVLVQWLEIQKNLGNVLLFSHIPNETYTTSWKQKSKNKASGVRRGVPDYIIVMATGTLCLIELKRVKGGRATPEQLEWIDAFNTCGNSVHAKVCCGANEAIKFVEKFLPFEKAN